MKIILTHRVDFKPVKNLQNQPTNRIHEISSNPSLQFTMYFISFAILHVV